MAVILSLTGIIILSVMAIKYPPFTFAIFMLTTSRGDGYGVNGYLLSRGFGIYIYLISIPVILSVLVTFIRLQKLYLEKRVSQRVIFIAVLAIFSMIWAGLVSIYNGRDIITILRDVTGIQIYVIIFVLAYWEDPKAKKLFIFVLLTQLCLGALLMFFPYSPLSVISARNYLPQESYPQLAQPESFDTIDRISGLTTIRAAAQFYNENAYGYYSVFGLLFGLFFLFKKHNTKLNLLGLLLIFTGAVGWKVTVSRGATLALIVALLFLLLRLLLAHKSIKESAIFILKTSILLGVVAFVLYLIAPPWSDLNREFEAAFSDNNYVYRISAINYAPEIIMRFPVFGIPSSISSTIPYSPHESILYFTTIYGIPVGIIVLLFFLYSLLGSTISNPLVSSNSDDDWNNRLFFTLACFSIVVDFSNATAAGVMSWLCIGLSCIPWAREQSLTKQFGKPHFKRGVNLSDET